MLISFMYFFKVINISHLLILLSLVFTNISIAKDNAGERGGGGDTDVPEFREIALQIHQSIKNIPLYTDHFKIPMNEFKRKVLKSQILAVEEELLVDGEIKVAWNNYSDLIKVNISRWKAIQSPVLKKRLVFHEILSLMKLEWNNFYLISNTLYNEQFIAPLPIDFGIIFPLSSIDKSAIPYLTGAHDRSLDVSLYILNNVYQYTIEELLKIYNSVLNNPTQLEKEYRVIRLQEMIKKHLNKLASFTSEFNLLFQRDIPTLDKELEFSQVILRYTQAYTLILQMKDLIGLSAIFKEHIKELKSSNPEYAQEVIRKLQEEDVKSRKAFQTVVFSELDNLEELIKSRLKRIQRAKISNLKGQFYFILDLL